MSALKKLETGVPGLDVLTMGGIPEGRSTCIAGKSGTGKAVVGLQIGAVLPPQAIDPHGIGDDPPVGEIDQRLLDGPDVLR